MQLSAIIVAAGGSRRMGFDKLSSEIAGESVLARSMQAFESCPEVSEILVVTSPEREELVRAAVRKLNLAKFSGTAPGGAERHLSVASGLAKVGSSCDFVAVHDGARPLVTPAAISLCAAAAERHGAAALAHRIVDTLKRGNADDEVSGSVSRENLWAMETPQIFSLTLLREAYAEVERRGGCVTDEVSAVEAMGRAVRLVENPAPNPKITVPSDLVLAEALAAAEGSE